MSESETVPGRLDARYRAFLETIATLRPKLHRYCARMTGSTLDGEDVVQDALFDAYRRLDTYDDSRPIGPWLFRTEGREYPAVAELQKSWTKFSGRLVAAINQLSAEELAAPSPIPLPHGEKTLLDALRFIVWHEGLHLGQVALLRSHHGLTPLVTLIFERAAAA